MPYIGHNPTNAGSFALIDDIASNFNGSNTTFTLQVGNVNITPNAQNTIIALDGVIQHTPESYTISGSTIAFTGAPASGTDFYGILMGNSSYVENNSIGADELTVTGDGTSLQVLTSDGDGTFSWVSQSALTPSANLVTGNTLKSTVVSSSLTSVGTLTSLTVDDITINGSTISDAGAFDIDAGGVIKLDAGGGQIQFFDDGTEIGVLENSSSDFVIESKVQDKDILFKGNDGGTGIELMRMNMSGANVGISTGNSIGAKLHVAHSSSTAYNGSAEILESTIIQNTNGTDDSGVNNVASLGLQVADGATSQGFINYVRTGNNTGDFTFSQRTGSSSYAEAMRIDSLGNVGIGASGSNLNARIVRGFSANKGLVIETAQPAIHMVDTDNTGRYFTMAYEQSAKTVYMHNQSNGPIRFDTNGTERMNLTGDGSLLIGTSGFGSAGTTLKQLGTAWSTSTGWDTTNTGTFTGIAISNPHADGGTACGIQFSHHAGSSGVSYIVSRAERAYSSGGDRSSLHFGTRGSDGVQRRMIIGDSGVITMSNVYGRAVGSTKRAVYVGDGGDLGYDSSVREHKMDIKSLSDVTWLSDLNPVSFYRRKIKQDGTYGKTKDGSIEYGLIADEVEKVNKDFVFYDIDEDENKVLAGVEYRQLMIPMLKKIQELEAKVTSLENA